MDEGERYKLGDFDSCEDAVNACKKIVDEYFAKLEKGKHTFQELWDGYKMYGEDPFVSCKDKECKFSAWDYAKQKCKEYEKPE